MPDSITLSCNWYVATGYSTYFIILVWLIAAHYAWMRGANLIPGTFIPTSPMYITPRKKALTISAILLLISFFFTLARPIYQITFQSASSVSVTQQHDTPYWTFHYFAPGKTKTTTANPTKISYLWAAAKHGNDSFIYYLEFPNGITHRTIPLEKTSAKEFQRFLQAHAPNTQWVYTPFF